MNGILGSLCCGKGAHPEGLEGYLGKDGSRVVPDPKGEWAKRRTPQVFPSHCKLEWESEGR